MQSVIVDVRTPKEFRDGSLPGAINLPSDQFEIEHFLPFKNSHICLICESGRRAESIFSVLKKNGFEQVSLLENQMVHLQEQQKRKNTWTVDRQFRLTLSLLLGLFFIGVRFEIPSIWIVPTIIFLGLFYSAITDNCYLKKFIASLPWNKMS